MRLALAALVVDTCLAASAPICDAGKTAAMTPGQPYQLDGSASVSNNNSPSLSYYWRQLNGH